jgi:hypothetical protein
MSRKDARSYQQQGQQVGALSRLQNDEQKYTRIQQHKKTEKYTGAYLVHVTCHVAVNGTHDAQDKYKCEYRLIPRLKILKADRLKGYQFNKGSIEQIHSMGGEGISEQEPIRYAPTDEQSEKTPDSKRPETVRSYD